MQRLVVSLVLLALGSGLGAARSPCQLRVIHDLTGTQPNGSFGSSAVFCGDVDKDGVVDFAVGAEQQNAVFVFSGKSGKLVRTLPGPQGCRSGFAMAFADDVDRDGWPDLAVGAPNTFGAGQTLVYSGRDGSVLHTFRATTSRDGFGAAIAAGGDVNGDGYPDVVVSVTWSAPTQVHVFSGKDATRLRTFGETEAGGGIAAAALADLDRDGRWDIVVGAQLGGIGGGGRATAFSGATGNPLWAVDGEPGDYLGTRISSVGDVDADGVSDVLASGRLPEGNRGRVLVLSGKDGRVIRTHFGERDDDWLGSSLGGCGDVDGDGTVDYALAAHQSGKGPGEVTVYSGRWGKRIARWPGRRQGEQFGTAVAGGADLDADGQPDVLVTTFYHQGMGRAEVYSVAGLGTRAGYAAMREPSGPSVLPMGALLGTAPPVLGQSMTLAVHTPGYDFALLLQAAAPLAESVPMKIAHTLLLHVDPAVLLNVFSAALAVQTGRADFVLPLPADRNLLGVDLAWQAFSFSISTGHVGATNLLLSNLGNDATQGVMPFAYQHKARLAASVDLRGPIYFNYGAAEAMTITGRFDRRSSAPIHVRTAPGNGGLWLTSIAPNQTDFRVTVYVPPGLPERPTPIHLYNTDTASIGMTWSLRFD